MSDSAPVLNAFCVDLEEWFHVCGVGTPYADPATWDRAPTRVVQNTTTLLRMLDDAGAKGTFLTVGWVAERHPELIREIARAGHEVGCHGYYHRLVFEQSPEAFREEIVRARGLLESITGCPVVTFRAPGFSITREAFWCYPILAAEGIRIDVSIVPAPRDHGGVPGFRREPFRLRTEQGELTVFPVSVMTLLGRRSPFSGGGYLRLLPMRLIHRGFRENHRRGVPVMTYIHPREIDPAQPRLELPRLKRFKYYVGLARCEARLRALLARYRFGTVQQVLQAYPHRLPTLSFSADGAAVPVDPATDSRRTGA